MGMIRLDVQAYPSRHCSRFFLLFTSVAFIMKTKFSSSQLLDSQIAGICYRYNQFVNCYISSLVSVGLSLNFLGRRYHQPVGEVLFHYFSLLSFKFYFISYLHFKAKRNDITRKKKIYCGHF